MTDQQINAWFWILVGASGGLAIIGLLYLAAFAFASCRRRVASADADRRIVVPLKRDS